MFVCVGVESDESIPSPKYNIRCTCKRVKEGRRAPPPLPQSHRTHREQHDVGRLERIFRREEDAPVVDAACEVGPRGPAEGEVPLEEVFLRVCWV